jgi:hypothetical protein
MKCRNPRPFRRSNGPHSSIPYNALVRLTAKRILVLLLLGMIINVAVAWWCEHFYGTDPFSESPPPNPGAWTEEDAVREWWLAHRPEGFADDVTMAQARLHKGIGLDRRLYFGYVRGEPEPEHYRTENAQEHRAGRPWRSLRGEKWVRVLFTVDEELNLTEVEALTIHRWGFSPELPADKPPAYERWPFFPLMPMWPGFALNTLLYAWLLVMAQFIVFNWPFQLRRFVRRRRGRCPACGYDLRKDFDAGCPECGWNRPREATT